MSSAVAVDNPYLREWREQTRGWVDSRTRTALVKQYAWAIPDEEALAIVATHSPLIEIGAGNGYWAHLLRQMGADVLAFDAYPPGCGASDWYGNSTAWTEVLPGGPEKVAEYPDRTLFLCWPCYSKPMARECLEAYPGDTVIYVGEGTGGCNADDAFFSLLGEDAACYHCDEGHPEECYRTTPCAELPAAEWESVRVYEIPQWWGIHDYLHVYRRLEALTPAPSRRRET